MGNKISAANVSDREKQTSSPFSPVFRLPGINGLREVTQKLRFNDLLLSNLDAWVVVLGNRTRCMYIDIPLAHSETDIQDSDDEPASVATLCYTIRM